MSKANIRRTFATDAGEPLSLLDLLLWMAGAAFLLACWRATDANLSDSGAGGLLFVAAAAAVFAPGVAAWPVLAVALLRSQRFPCEPGHWLLLWSGVVVGGSSAVWAGVPLLAADGEPSHVAFAVGRGVVLTLAALTLACGAVQTKERNWRLGLWNAWGATVSGLMWAALQATQHRELGGVLSLPLIGFSLASILMLFGATVTDERRHARGVRHHIGVATSFPPFTLVHVLGWRYWRR